MSTAARPQVWITDYIKNPSIEQNIILPHFDIVASKSSETSGLIVWHERFPQDFFNLTSVRCVSRFGAGLDNIDLVFCKENGISVYSVPDYGVDEVSDTALAFVLSRTRGVFEYSRSIFTYPQGSWESNIISHLRRTSSLALGIIGLGRIGSALARKARALGYNVFCYDPFIKPGFHKIVGAELCDSLSSLYANCDIISINCPLDELTTGLVDFQEVFDSSKKAISVVNTARGAIAPPLVDVCAAIRDGLIYSYDTDVLAVEPPSAQDLLLLHDPLIQQRLTLCPHTSFYSQQSFSEMRVRASLNLVDAMNHVDSVYRVV